MVSLATERILLVGDSDRHVHACLTQALPMAQVTAVPTIFDAIAELAHGRYTTVLAAAEPIERRPEAAVRALRSMCGEGRLLLFGHPTLEPLSRKMLQFGCDDYVVTPATPVEYQQMLGSTQLKLSPAPSSDAPAARDGFPEPVAGGFPLIDALPVAEIVVDALLKHPGQAPAIVMREINDKLGPEIELAHAPPGRGAPQPSSGRVLLSHATRLHDQITGTLHLELPANQDQASARHLLAQLAHAFGKLDALRERHHVLERAAITDDLTGLFNGRYFKLFLAQILKKAHEKRFPVTLLLFDIDNFKRYNDLYGHGVGDEILKQTATLIRRCCREHDKVARISGDEFAVIFWDKEPPRQPRDASKIVNPSRVPQTIVTILERFQGLISSSEFSGLGSTGRGTLTISGGLAVYPYDATTPEALVEAADRALMFGAKKSGKNSIFLVGTGDDPPAASS